MKTVAIIQSNYIPWKGYFDLIASVDEFIIFDDMQFTRRDWRNRNKVKTPNGLKWLTVPVEVKGKYEQAIRDTKISDPLWAASHLKSLKLNYARARYFEQIWPFVEALYDKPSENLSELNVKMIKEICSFLGIGTKISKSWDYTILDGKSERLASLCRQAGGDIYVSGPAAKDYLDESVFERQHMAVQWFDYAGYPEYEQLWGEFEHGVTILDLLFNCGDDAKNSMKWV